MTESAEMQKLDDYLKVSDKLIFSVGTRTD